MADALARARDALAQREARLRELQSDLTFKAGVVARLSSTGLVPAPAPADKPSGSIRMARGIQSPADVASFLASPTCAALLGFVSALNASVRQPPLAQARENWADAFLARADRLVGETPLEDFDPQRFGNRAFRTWHAKLARECAAEDEELATYFTRCFGDPQRLDFGTGHEVAFVMLLFALHARAQRSGDDLNSFLAHASQRTFATYMRVVRRLRGVYRLEPAGSHGVWSLDDFHFLPFILGSSQMMMMRPATSPPPSRPAQILSNPVSAHLEEHADFFTDAILDILRSKRGPFHEHSPLLHQLAGCESWEEMNAGLMRMWRGEVLGKFPVAQHFWFGPSLRVTWDSVPPPSFLPQAGPPVLPAGGSVAPLIAFDGESRLGGANDPLAKYFRSGGGNNNNAGSGIGRAPRKPPGNSSSTSSSRSVSFTLRPDGSGIDLVGDEWKMLSCADAPISGEEDCEQLKRMFPTELDFPFPEMLFSRNFLKLEARKVVFDFSVAEALRGCKLTKGGGAPDRKLIKVTMADKWEQRTDSEGNKIRTWRDDYDWTFTTRRLVRVSTAHGESGVREVRTPRRIDYELLKTREPILWAKEVLLFEDDLFDMGLSKLSVKIRVMPSCFFVLARFFLRVDFSYLRCFDVRVFHKFDQRHVLIERSEREADFQALKHLDPKDVNDPNVVSNLLPVTAEPITTEVALD